MTAAGRAARVGAALRAVIAPVLEVVLGPPLWGVVALAFGNRMASPAPGLIPDPPLGALLLGAAVAFGAAVPLALAGAAVAGGFPGRRARPARVGALVATHVLAVWMIAAQSGGAWPPGYLGWAVGVAVAALALTAAARSRLGRRRLAPSIFLGAGVSAGLIAVHAYGRTVYPWVAPPAGGAAQVVRLMPAPGQRFASPELAGGPVAVVGEAQNHLEVLACTGQGAARTWSLFFVSRASLAGATPVPVRGGRGSLLSAAEAGRRCRAGEGLVGDVSHRR